MKTACSESHGCCEKLNTQLDLLYAYYMCMMQWVWENQNSKNQSDYFVINRAEMKAIRMNPEELLSLLIAGDVDNEWVQAIHHFDYLTPNQSVMTAVPGSDINSLRIIRIYLNYDPVYFPFTSLINVFEQTCREAGLKYMRVLFSFDSMIFENTSRFIRFLKYSCYDREAFRQALRDWHLTTKAKINGDAQDVYAEKEYPLDDVPVNMTRRQKILFLKSRLHSFHAQHYFITELTLSRKEMAIVLNVKIDTVRHWESDRAPSGIIWPKPQKDINRRVYYPVSIYLPMMQKLQIVR